MNIRKLNSLDSSAKHMCLFVLTSVGLSGSISCAGAENLTSVEITELKQSYQRERMKMF